MWVPEIGEKYWICVAIARVAMRGNGQKVEAFEYIYNETAGDNIRIASGLAAKSKTLAVKNHRRAEIKIKVAKIAERFPVDWRDVTCSAEAFVWDIANSLIDDIEFGGSYDPDAICGHQGFCDAVREELTEEELLLYVKGE